MSRHPKEVGHIHHRHLRHQLDHPECCLRHFRMPALWLLLTLIQLPNFPQNKNVYWIWLSTKEKAYSLLDQPVHIYNYASFHWTFVLNSRFFLGTGKSVLMRGNLSIDLSLNMLRLMLIPCLAIIDRLKRMYRETVAVTASTGIAACNIGGCTLHR